MAEENPPTPSTSGTSKKKEEKARKKDQRSWDNVLKSMGDMPEVERIGVIQQRYVSLYNDLRQTASCYQHLEKRYISLQRERDQARAELNKNILAKAKLESLCRELQKQNKAIKGEEYDENERLISSDSEDEDSREQLIQLLDPSIVISALAGVNPSVLDFSDLELDAAGDESLPQLDFESDTEPGENPDETVIDLQGASSSSEILVREARSVPVTKKDHQAIIDGELEEPSSSSGDLNAESGDLHAESGDLEEELSLETLPLYKPAAVTDVPTQGGHVTLVKESEARTNILEPLEATDEDPGEQTTASEDTKSSSATINLKESEGKTEIKKE